MMRSREYVIRLSFKDGKVIDNIHDLVCLLKNWEPDVSSNSIIIEMGVIDDGTG